MKKLLIVITGLLILTSCASPTTEAPTSTETPTAASTATTIVKPTTAPTVTPTAKPTTAPAVTPTAKPKTAPAVTPTMKPKTAPREPTRLGISFDAEISSAEVKSWVEQAVGEMLDPPTDFFGLIWPIGSPVDDEPDPHLFDGAGFSEHEHKLSPAEVDETVASFVNWQAGLEGCTDAEKRNWSDGARVVSLWIRNAADVATAPGPCLKSRAAIYARTLAQDKTTATEIFFHEAYHGLSNKLLNLCATNAPGRSEDDLNNRRWFSEGTADYFGVYMAAKIEGRENYRQKILERAYLDVTGDPGMGLDSAYVQAAAVVLMIDRGMISEEKLLNGSYFHNCSWIDEFDPLAVGIDYIFENFNKIQLIDGKYSYSSEVISG
jgi:hypothetical protein